MRSVLPGLRSVFLAVVASAALAGPARAQVVDSSYATPEGERVLELSIEVPASRAEVWQAFTTAEGFRSFGAPVARVDLRVGGEYETSYDPAARFGAPGNIRNAIVALVPERLIVIRNVQAPPNTPFDVPTFQSMQTAVRFDAIDDRRTRVTLQNPGYRAGPLYDGVYRHFSAGNAWVLMKLRERFERGPIDWNAARPTRATKKLEPENDAR